MQTEMPFFEGPEDALRAAVQALGGAKKVGSIIFPDKGVDAAARHLLDCINASRNEKLDLSQVMLILSMAKESGIHAPFSWFASQVGYDCSPITKAEEIDRLTTVVEQASKTLSAAVTALERIKVSGNVTKLDRAA